MKIPLDQLLQRITPLPWPNNKRTLTSSESRANHEYAKHAANTLPELVEAMQGMLKACAPHELEHPAMYKAWHKANTAIARAKSVEVGG